MIRWLAIGTALLAPPLALAQQAASNDELAAQATDPTAQLMSFQLSDVYTASYHGLDDTANQVVFRAAIPFDLGATRHIFRVTQPYATSGPAGGGLIDTTIFDLVVFDQSWGRWGVGVSGTLPTGQRELHDRQMDGRPSRRLRQLVEQAHQLWPVLAVVLFVCGKGSVPDVGILNFQPIFSYQLGGGRSLSLGNSALVYDTEKSRWASLFASVNYGQVVSFAGQKWRPNFEVGYDFKDDPGNPKWVIRAGISLLLPK